MSRWKHRRCVVYGCEGDSNGITTHRVPQDAKLRHMWLQRIGVLSSALKTDIYVCRRHFSSDDYVRNPEVMRAVGFHAFHRKYVLKRGAVPSLNLPTDPQGSKAQPRQSQTTVPMVPSSNSSQASQQATVCHCSCRRPLTATVASQCSLGTETLSGVGSSAVMA